MKSTIKINAISFLGFAVILSACANQPHRISNDSRDKHRGEHAGILESQKVSHAAATKVDAHNFVEIEFSIGQSTLSDSARTSVRSVYDQAQEVGKIDEEFPSKKLKSLSKSQKELATKRNENIESFVNELRPSTVQVEKFNMAEQPNMLAKWFNTTDNKLKASLVAAGLPTSASDPQYPSKASHSLILIKLR
jgi:hypothetical protein